MTTTATPNPMALDPRTYARGRACVHCGLCLPACPTYTQNQNEADSPRGRIQLMLALSDGTIQPTDSARKHLDLCLDCRGCETACPSGVVYHELIEETRANLSRSATPGLQVRVMNWIFSNILTHPTRLKLAMLPGRVFKRLGLFNILPASLRKMGQMLPSNGSWWPAAMPQVTYGHRQSKQAVSFFPTCVGSVVYSEVNRKAAKLLNERDTDVHVSPEQVCCGAIHLHNGDHETALKLARTNIDVLLPADSHRKYIVTTVAGCGAMLREYATLLRDDPDYRERAIEFSSRVRDISEVLVEVGLPEMKHPVKKMVTYHDACHLAHAQKVTAAPRKLLEQIPGVKVVNLPESDICCGAAGTYNLTQPAMATDLATRKLNNISSTGCSTCAAGNVGCAMHIQSQADARGQELDVVHPVELIYDAVFGVSGNHQ